MTIPSYEPITKQPSQKSPLKEPLMKTLVVVAALALAGFDKMALMQIGGAVAGVEIIYQAKKSDD